LAAAPGISGDSATLSPGLGAVAATASDQVDCLPDRLGRRVPFLSRGMTARAVELSTPPARAFSKESGMSDRFAPSRIQDTMSFRADWSSGLSATDIGLKYRVQGRSVTRRAMQFGYPRRGRDHQILGAMPAHPAIDAPAPHVVAEVVIPKALEGKGHPRWPLEYDAAILKTDGKYSRIANLSRSLGRSVNAILGRWHQLRAQ
jgi:hypothetical protein